MFLSPIHQVFLLLAFMQSLIAEPAIGSITRNINVSFKVPEKVIVLQESLRVVSNTPHVTVHSFELLSPVKKDYDQILKDIHTIENNIDLMVNITQDTNEHFTLTVRYQDKQSKKFFDKVIAIKDAEKITAPASTIASAPTNSVDSASPNVQSSKKEIYNPIKKASLFARLSNYIDDLVTKSNSLWVQLIAVFLLGILMSLTPCIYPMIPITAGILQSYGSKSFTHNLIVSVLYALGVATTFSMFGLVSASTGKLFGNLLTNPLFILILVAILAYFALTMLGVFEMYIPRFMQTNTQVKKKSIFSAYIFGIISGSVASPCLTPGLALLLTLVATLANKFLGFLLLFTAGIGLALPLLIIGTFSSSLSILPRAGMWMIEIKKLFGFILFGMCFYFLHNIIPSTYFIILLSIFLCASGIYYFASIKKHDTKRWKLIKNIIGALLIASSIGVLLQMLNAPVAQETINTAWEENLNLALEDGKALHKKVLIDVTGKFCSICRAIERKILNAPHVQEYLDEHVIKVKIDASQQQESYAFLQEKYTIIGVPTILLIDPTTMEQVGRWGSQLYAKTPEEFINELKQLR